MQDYLEKTPHREVVSISCTSVDIGGAHIDGYPAKFLAGALVVLRT